jgi:hypothetical protein
MGEAREVDTENDPTPAIGMTGARFGGTPRRRRTARQRAAEARAAAAAGKPPDPEALQDAETAAMPTVPAMPPASAAAAHHAGARQHGAPPGPVPPGVEPDAWRSGAVPPGGDRPGLARIGGVPDPEPSAPGATGPDAEVPDGPAVGLTGARFGGARRRTRPQSPAAEPTPATRREPEVPAPPTDGPPAPAVPVAAPEPNPGPDPEPVAGGSAFVRPYVLTRGRTRSSFVLSIETLVSAAADAAPAGLTGEHQVVLGLCREPRSVAELAAGVGVPLGVARVLVGDLAAAGTVAVHRSAGDSGPDMALMERVLSGLRRL